MALSKAAGAVGGTLLIGSMVGCILTPELSVRKVAEFALIAIPLSACVRELNANGRPWQDSILSVYFERVEKPSHGPAFHFASPFRAAGRYYLLTAVVCALPFYYTSLKSTPSFVARTTVDIWNDTSETVFGVVNKHDAPSFPNEAVQFNQLPAFVRCNHALASAAVRSAFWPLLSLTDTRIRKIRRNADGTTTVDSTHCVQSLF